MGPSRLPTGDVTVGRVVGPSDPLGRVGLGGLVSRPRRGESQDDNCWIVQTQWGLVPAIKRRLRGHEDARSEAGERREEEAKETRRSPRTNRCRKDKRGRKRHSPHTPIEKEAEKRKEQQLPQPRARVSKSSEATQPPWTGYFIWTESRAVSRDRHRICFLISAFSLTSSLFALPSSLHSPS